MAWSQIDITDPHLVYIILGGFTSLFMLCSSFIKERLYIGEATVATLCGVIFGPYVANLINPNSWGSVDEITIEFSRIVLVVQCFAIGVELPKFYMEKHWKSVVFLLVPVMTFGWLIVSLFIWWMIPAFSWLESLIVAACVTATDPVLASSVVGKGKFAKRVPKHLRDLLSAESGCNDGMAFPFIYLSLYLVQYHLDAKEVSFHFIVYVVLYECIFGAFYGFMIGYIARHGIRLAERRDLIDRESFLVFYFVLALFCAGSGSILGVDDLLVGFAAGVGFSNDGWFLEKTEESHVSNVIDLLINLAYFVYFGTIIPWDQYNNGFGGVYAWRLVVIAIMVIFFRRIPIMLALKPFIPDVKTWREALFAGHFGPIGVGAIFVALLARAELEHEEPIPEAELPQEGSPYYNVIYLVWPIVSFMVITSILVHGSSIAVFTLGKRINTLTITMSYTAAPDEGPTWMNRLPRISSQSKSQGRTMSETSIDEYKGPEFPPNTLAPPYQFLRRQKEEDAPSRQGSRPSSLVSKKRKKNNKWDDGIGPGGPISQSAIFPNRQSSVLLPGAEADPSEKAPTPPGRTTTDSSTAYSPKDSDPEKLDESRAEQEKAEEEHEEHEELDRARSKRIEIFEEGDQMLFENEDGDVLDIQPSPQASRDSLPEPVTAPMSRQRSKSEASPFWSLGGFKKRMADVYSSEVEKRKIREPSGRSHEPARAYQFGNTIIVEDEDGEVVKTYELPSAKPEGQGSNAVLGSSLKYMGLGNRNKASATAAEKSPERSAEEGESSAAAEGAGRPGWAGRLASGTAAQKQKQAADDKKIRFTIGGVGQRMTKEDFINEVRKMDAGTRKEVIEHSNASPAVRAVAERAPSKQAVPQLVETGPSPSSSSERVGRHQRKRSASTPLSPKSSPLASSSLAPAAAARRPSAVAQPSERTGETAVERRRRLAVLDAQDEADDEEVDTGETPAERRRREAALGMAGDTASDSDSDDEGGERVPPAARKGIRFAEPTRR